MSGWLTVHNDGMFGKTGGHKGLFVPIDGDNGQIVGGLIGRTAKADRNE
jgi:hypothetical protein